VFGEERDRGGLHADRRAAPDGAVGHVVQVVVEDPALRVLVLELRGELGLADLAREGALGVLDVERPYELLRDRGASLHRVAGLEVADAGAHDRVEVHPLVLVEALVLDRDRRAPQLDRDVPPRHDRAHDVRLDVAEP
jgi:hypothetical protein